MCKFAEKQEVRVKKTQDLVTIVEILEKDPCRYRVRYADGDTAKVWEKRLELPDGASRSEAKSERDAVVKFDESDVPPGLKAQVAIAAVQGDLQIADLAEKYHIEAVQIVRWQHRLMDQAYKVFRDEAVADDEGSRAVKKKKRR